MTQPASDRPVPQNPQQSGHAGGTPAYGELYRSAGISDRDGGSPVASPDAVPEPVGRDLAGWRRFAIIAGAGIPVGLLWWLLAPGGLNLLTGNRALATGTNAEV